MVNISNVLLVVLVAVIVFWIFENINAKSSEKFDQNIIPEEEIMHRHFEENPIVPKLKTIPTINACPLKENDLQTNYYITKYLMGGGAEINPKPVQSIKDFNKDFFKFRDYTYNNSSMTVDSVDKIANLYLDGNLGEARNFPGMKIRDIYDNLTAGTNLYQRSCVRVPSFDNTMHDGYNYSFLTGMHNTRDNWQYPNEKEINGGQLEKNFYANDPEDLQQLPVLN